MNPVLRRRFLDVAGRRMHLWTGGSGPALVMMHGSPGNAWLVKPLAVRLARHFQVYAVDTPGFGDSEPLPGETLLVADLADAYADLFDSIGLANAAVYGTHTGAAIGLELARRHPSRISGFVLDGVPIFTAEEQRPLLDPHYMQQFEPEPLGGHYSRVWTRFHDQFVWFPWYRPEPAFLNEADAGSAADIHLWVQMYFQAMRNEYRPAYRAAISYGEAAVSAASAARSPGVYMALQSDMLFPHLQRLPPLAAGQRIEKILEGEDMSQRVELALLSLPKSAAGVALDHAAADPEYSFHDLPNGQMFVRTRGTGRGTPLLLLHDAPGAGGQLVDLYEALSADRRVILPDLPCCGQSDPLDEDVGTSECEGSSERAGAGSRAAGLAAYADALADMLTAGASRVDVYGIGAGAALALELNARHPRLVGKLMVTGLLRAEGSDRHAMLGRLAPPIVLCEDGSHWYRVWAMLRNSLVRWPWYAREPAALRRQPLPLEAGYLHAWTCDVMRQSGSYHRLIDAVLSWDPAAALAAGHDQLTIAIDPLNALHASDAHWASTSRSRSVKLPADAAGRSTALLAALQGRG
jgi:pimeloyl-ACP methyl ester carboxylesterase